MKTTVDLPPEQIDALEAISKARNVSLDQLVRDALELYIRPRNSFKDHPAFGMWKNRADIGDGVAYQQELRAEWDREWDPPR